MSTLTVLTLGVCLGFGLQAADISTYGSVDASPPRCDVDSSAGIAPADAGTLQLHGACVTSLKSPAERAAALYSYAIALHRSGRNTEARAALERALAEWSEEAKVLPRSTGDAARRQSPLDDQRILTYTFLSSTDRSLGDYRGAELALRSAMAEGTGRPDIRAGVMLNLADLLREEARDNEAGSLLDEARHLTGLSGKVEDTILIETAELTRDTRRWSESIELWSKVAEVAERERSVSLEAIAAGGLGETWYDAGNPARAEPLLRRSLQLLRDDPGRSPGQLSVALALIARLYVDEGKLALAAEAVDEAISKDETSLGPDHPQVAILLELRAGILSRRGDGASAREDLERARIVMSSHFGAESPATAGVLAALGDVEERANRPAAAVFEYGRAMDLLRSSGQGPATFGAGLLTRYAAALKATHHNDEARAILKVAGAQGFREK